MKLEIKDLDVLVEDRKILSNFSLNINEGEIHALMGPNGTGKSSLSKVIMGNNKYKVVKGDILVNNESILSLETYERARLGIFLSMQNPTSIDGVKNSEFLRTAISSLNKEKKMTVFQFLTEANSAIADLKMDPDMLYRSVNFNFSGGERKKNEILQMKLLKPKLIILDEIDSGLDVDSLKIVCENINNYLKENPTASVLMITHYSRIFEYLKPDYIHMMIDGNIKKTGTISLAYEIEKEGYNMMNKVSEIDQDE